MHQWLLTLLLLSPVAMAANTATDMQIYTIPVQHQTPASLVPTLKPLIPEGGYITSHGNNIIVRTHAENLAEIELLLTELDQPLIAVIISVRRGNQYDGGNTHIQVNGKYIGDNGSIIIGGKNESDHNHSGLITTSTSTTVITRRTSTMGTDNNHYQVRGLSGKPSYIHTGQDIPITSSPITSIQTRSYHLPLVQQEYKSVKQGFYATPYIYGERVNIDIHSQYDRVDNSHRQSNNTVINTESIQTQVNGRLGEWIAIGGFNQNQNTNHQGLTHYQTTQSLSAQTIYLKVEKAPH